MFAWLKVIRKDVARTSNAQRIQNGHSLLISGISNLLAGCTCTFLDVLGSIHGGSLNLLGLSLDLVACVTGEVPIGGFEFAFCIFGSGIKFV